jgi:NIMA (never in mitosis gene a)-related kinase
MIQGKKFDFDTIMNMISQIVLGLMAMHSKKILHRDIKTQNIFITKSNVLKIGDFGIAKELTNFDEKAVTSLGTPYFMPPEVILG